MARLTEEFVKNRIIEWLSREGYGKITKVSTLAEHGVDIRAQRVKSSLEYRIEVKGDHERQSREVAFIVALGQILTRVTRKKYCKHAVAFPQTYRDLVLRKIPWIAAKRLDLEALLVSEEGKVSKVTWKDLREQQIRKRKDNLATS